MKRLLPFIIIALVAVAAVAGGIIFYRAKVASLTPAERSTGTGPVPEKESEQGERHVRGPANAPATLEEYGDFQCPPCGMVAGYLLKIEHDFGPQLRVIFRNFPLSAHNHAMEAAQAAEAAGLQGKFWEMHDLLFKNQAIWSKEADVKPVFMNYAQDVGLDLGRFENDYTSEAVRERIKADQARGTGLGVTSTPTMFLNGHPMPPPQMAEPSLRAAITAAAKGETLPWLKTTPTPTPAPAVTPAEVSSTPASTPTPTASAAATP